MDRIWGGFMDEIKEEDENGTPMPPASPDTKARQARVDFEPSFEPLKSIRISFLEILLATENFSLKSTRTELYHKRISKLDLPPYQTVTP